LHRNCQQAADMHSSPRHLSLDKSLFQ
jgi:hypothetical protein